MTVHPHANQVGDHYETINLLCLPLVMSCDVIKSFAWRVRSTCIPKGTVLFWFLYILCGPVIVPLGYFNNHLKYFTSKSCPSFHNRTLVCHEFHCLSPLKTTFSREGFYIDDIITQTDWLCVFVVFAGLLTHLPPGYQQRWQCSEYQNNNIQQKRVHAYVDGGMWFNQTDKSLYVPSCGYYYVYSQITFKCRPLTASKTVYHSFKFNRNCPHWADPIPLAIQGMSTVGPFTDGTQAGSTTTYTGDIIKMCQGGRMWIEIPDGPNGVPCPPYGDEESTFMGAVLIANTTCHWPPEMTLTNLNN